MATTDEADVTNVTEDTTDILDIESKVDAKARQWLVRIQTNFWQFDAAVKTRVAWFNDNHYNPLNLYIGIQDHYQALLADLNKFREYLDDNGFSKGSSYYKYYDAYTKYYGAYSDVAKPPALVQEDLDRGKLVGICDKVDDGDTLFIGEKEIRLVGINTQEKGTFRGGGAATRRLKELCLGKVITVYFDPNTPLEMYRRVLGAVYLGDGDNLFLRDDWQDIFVNYILVNECLAEPNNKGRNMYIDPDLIKGAYEKCKLADSPDLVRVHIKSDKTHARIFIDGVDVMKVTPDTVDVTPGEHHLTLAADGCSAWHEDIVVGYGDNKIFRKLLALPTAVGVINIFTTPDDCDILVDGSAQGVAPIIGLQRIASAVVEITAVKEGYDSKTVRLVPMAGRSIDVKFDPLEKS